MSIKIKSIAGLILLAIVGFAIAVAAQPGSAQRKPSESVKAAPQESRSTENPQTAKVDPNLVMVPVIASSRTGSYISDLTKEEFSISEDDVPQQIAFLAAVSAPFHVVLLLDSSASTREKLPLIQRAASAFVDQLSALDKVKIISFDDRVRDWNEFTSDRSRLKGLIARTQSGEGTKVYDAMDLALKALQPVSGRKAIVIFTDGMDWHSDRSTLAGTLRYLEEAGVIVYPIRFETRAETERIARQQDVQVNGDQLPTSDVIRNTPPDKLPPNSPGEETTVLPPGVIARRPLPKVIVNQPDPRRDPRGGGPTDPFPSTEPPGQIPRAIPRASPSPSPSPSPVPTREIRREDNVTVTLDKAYSVADSYLKELSERSGGKLHRADSIAMLPQVFGAIAAELRTQYTIGYYPTNTNKDGGYRKIQVRTSRQDVAIRARPGYRPSAGN